MGLFMTSYIPRLHLWADGVRACVLCGEQLNSYIKYFKTWKYDTGLFFTSHACDVDVGTYECSEIIQNAPCSKYNTVLFNYYYFNSRSIRYDHYPVHRRFPSKMYTESCTRVVYGNIFNHINCFIVLLVAITVVIL